VKHKGVRTEKLDVPASRISADIKGFGGNVLIFCLTKRDKVVQLCFQLGDGAIKQTFFVFHSAMLQEFADFGECSIAYMALELRAIVGL
jgi:hypothetical protein